MVRTLSLTLALTFTLALAQSAAAQAPGSATESKSEQARRLFEEGVALAKSEDWAEALWAFRRSRGLVPRPSTSYNIANVLYRLDRPANGLAELDAYDEMPGVIADRAAQERGAMLRGLLENAAAQIQIAITPMDAEVYVDGRGSTSKGGDRAILLNPGHHSLRFTRDGYEPTTIDVKVERGSRQSHAVALRPKAPPSVAVELAEPALPESSIAVDPTVGPAIQMAAAESQTVENDRKPFVKRPGFWLMIGAIAAVGIGAGVAIALTRKDDAPPCGTTGTCATTQGLTITSF
jgi:hypothetical protein